MKISELEVLAMVGLDGYMLLRYQSICYKLVNRFIFPFLCHAFTSDDVTSYIRLALFMCFWGLLILIPLYSTAAGSQEWDQYTLSNVAVAQGDSRYRLWFAAIFGYIFSAYFCQLLHAEYNNFSVRRLQYLVQVR